MDSRFTIISENSKRACLITVFCFRKDDIKTVSLQAYQAVLLCSGRIISLPSFGSSFQCLKNFIPEQFTVNAHPALFEGRGEPKNEALLFQSTVDIHFQNAHKTHKKSRRLALCAFIFI